MPDLHSVDSLGSSGTVARPFDVVARGDSTRAGHDVSVGALAARIGIGAVAGACAWVAVRACLPLLPMWLRFAVAWLVFTIGPGAAVIARMTRQLDGLTRAILTLAVGTAAAPALIHALGSTHRLEAFPYIACGMAGIGIALWRTADDNRPRPTAGDFAACLVIAALALGTGAVAFAHRISSTANGVQVYGDYDSYDLSFYAVWASEATHTVPPTAAFYAGHALTAAYYPHLTLAMVRRFADVPLLSIYFGYAWPTFVAAGALMLFVLVRSIASRGTALLAAVLTLSCGDFSYLAAWALRHTPAAWDYLLWPTNFLDPTMEVLHFNNWTPSLPVFFGAMYAIIRGLRTAERQWFVLGALLLGVLFEFKPFAFAVVLVALGTTTLTWRGGGAARRQLAATTVLAVVAALPFVYGLLTQTDGRRSRLLIEWFTLPRRMLFKLDLERPFTALADRAMPVTGLRTPLVVLAATLLFFLVGLGVRWLGTPLVFRSLRSRSSETAPWRLLAWTVIAGVAIPFVVATDPYVDTLQFYQAGLYVLWIFTAAALIGFARRHGRAAGAAAIVLALAAGLPSSIHYLAMKWSDNLRPPIGTLSPGELAIGAALRTTDAEQTVFLDDRPAEASLLAIVAERRTVLAWGRPYYAVGSESRAREVNRFYASATRTPEVALDVLRRNHVTHVVVHAARNRVHAGALSALQPLLRFPDVTLYAVPAMLQR